MPTRAIPPSSVGCGCGVCLVSAGPCSNQPSHASSVALLFAPVRAAPHPFCGLRFIQLIVTLGLSVLGLAVAVCLVSAHTASPVALMFEAEHSGANVRFPEVCVRGDVGPRS